jgi:outer membrane protein
MQKPQRILREFSSHMKRSFAIAAILASGLQLSATAQMPASPGLSPETAAAPAAAAAPAGPAKIAVIAFQLAVAQTNEGQRDFNDLQKKYAPKEASLKSLSDEIDNLTKQLQTQGATLSEAERTNKAKTIDEKKKQLDRETEDLRNDGQQDMQDLYNSLASKVYDVMQSFAEQQGFTLILDISPQQSPVLFASDGTNITKQVIDAYNVKSGVPAPAAETGEAPKPRPTTPAAKPATSAPKPATQH